MKIQLSGFANGYAPTEITIDQSLLTTEAASWLSGTGEYRRLSWAGIRHLDILMKRAFWLEATGDAYIAECQRSCGRHLFSLLTQRRAYPRTPNDKRTEMSHFEIFGDELKGAFIEIWNTDHKILMRFPNVTGKQHTAECASLVGLQVDSRYRFFCVDQLNTTLQRNRPAGSPPFTLRNMANFWIFLRNDPRIEVEDRYDIYAYFLLQGWNDLNPPPLPNSKLPFIGNSCVVRTANGMLFTMPAPAQAPPRKLREAPFYQNFWRDFAFANFPNFADIFQVSPTYGPHTFPKR